MKKVFATVLAAAMVMSLLAGCGAATDTNTGDTGAQQETQEAASPAEETGDAESEQQADMINPWTDITAEEVTDYCESPFVIPEGATDVSWSVNAVMDGAALVQAVFTLDGMECTARTMDYLTGDESLDTGIAGVYYEWDATETESISGWDTEATVYIKAGEDEMIQLVTWKTADDAVYSLMVSAPDLDGFDITAIAAQMYPAE